MIANLDRAKAIGATVMRVVGSSLMFRFESHAAQVRRLTRMFREAVRAAEDRGIRMAVENHIDFTADEIQALLEDLKPQKGAPADAWYFFSSTPVGDGLVDNLALARLLKKANFQGFPGRRD
jgi:sugar phosphate isomerase/epimerase